MKAFSQARIGKAVLIIIGNVIPGFKGCLPSCQRRASWINLISRGHKRVILLNPPRPDVVSAYHAADLFIFGSNIECSPLVLFEAMASKTPFITVACGNAEEIVSWGHGGIVIPTISRPNGRVDADPKLLASAIEDLMNDPGRRQELAESGYKAWKDQFTWEKIAQEYERIYKTLLEI
jgi:glycosyltransferase involved in cell wall biosynthesis